jgi:hypothetical protein
MPWLALHTSQVSQAKQMLEKLHRTIRVLAKTAVLLVGLVAIQTATGIGQQIAVPSYRNDPRAYALRGFFDALDSPASDLAEDFLLAADHHGLDWRLLPSIAILESGGGRESMNNNILGWDSCRESFPSVQAGIHTVADRLANSKLYKNKDLDKKLKIYNPNAIYPGKVKRLMAKLTIRLERAAPAH